jgi:hypothetical protein
MVNLLNICTGIAAQNDFAEILRLQVLAKGEPGSQPSSRTALLPFSANMKRSSSVRLDSDKEVHNLNKALNSTMAEQAEMVETMVSAQNRKDNPTTAASPQFARAGLARVGSPLPAPFVAHTHPKLDVALALPPQSAADVAAEIEQVKQWKESLQQHAANHVMLMQVRAPLRLAPAAGMRGGHTGIVACLCALCSLPGL